MSRTTRSCFPGPSQSSAINGDFIDSHGSLPIAIPSWPSTSAGVLPNAHYLPSRADAPCCVVFYLRLLGRIHRGSLTPIMWTYMRLARAFCMCYHSPQRSAGVRASADFWSLRAAMSRAILRREVARDGVNHLEPRRSCAAPSPQGARHEPPVSSSQPGLAARAEAAKAPRRRPWE